MIPCGGGLCGGVGTGVENWFEDNICRAVSDGNNTFFWTDNWVDGVPLRTKFRRLFDLAVHREYYVADMVVLGWEYGGGAWVWKRGLLAWEEECVRECSSLLHNVTLQEHVSDSWRWLLEPIQGYSMRGKYHFLTAPDEVLASNGIHNV